MSAEETNAAFVEEMKAELLRMLTELLPAIINGLIPVVAGSLKTASEQYIQQHPPTFTEEMIQALIVSLNRATNTHVHQTTNTRTNTADENITDSHTAHQEYKHFCEKNKRFMNEMIEEREEQLYWYTKCDRYFDLFSGYLQENTPYVPRKFRKDKYDVRSAAEFEEVKKFELQQFKSSCEILRMRLDGYRNEVFQIDKRVEEFVKNQRMSAPAKTKALDRWKEVTNEDFTRMNKKWDKKMTSLKEAHARDREFVTNQINSRFTEVPPSNSTSNNDWRNIFNGGNNVDSSSSSSSSSSSNRNNIAQMDVAPPEHEGNQEETFTFTIPADKLPPGVTGNRDLVTLSIPRHKLHHHLVDSLDGNQSTGSGDNMQTVPSTVNNGGPKNCHTHREPPPPSDRSLRSSTYPPET